MQPQALDGHMGREIEIDLCEPCQSIWFDARENLQLTPGATLAMFRVIGEHVSQARRRRIATSRSARAATRSCGARRTCSATPASSISAARTITAA